MIARTTFALVTISTLVSAQVPVIGIWELDEASGLVANDVGPAGNHGTLVNFTNDPAQWTPGAFGNALTFDGIDDYVEFGAFGGMPCFNGYGETFTICMWVNGTPTDDDRVLSLGSSTNNTPLFTLGTGAASQGQTSQLRAYVRNTLGYSSSRVSMQTVFDNSWHHVAYVENSGSARLYVDGVLDPTNFDNRFGPTGTRAYARPSYGLDKIALGAVLRPSICCYYTGSVDALRVYGSALSQADVVTVMSGGNPTVCRASMGEYGVGCGPGPFEMWASGSSQLGGTLWLSMRGAGGAGSALLGLGAGIPSPLDLGIVGFPSCTLYPAGASFLGLGALDPTGSLPLAPFPIPNAPSLACVTITLQGVGVTATDASFSNAVVAVLGF